MYNVAISVRLKKKYFINFFENKNFFLIQKLVGQFYCQEQYLRVLRYSDRDEALQLFEPFGISVHTSQLASPDLWLCVQRQRGAKTNKSRSNYYNKKS